MDVVGGIAAAGSRPDQNELQRGVEELSVSFVRPDLRKDRRVAGLTCMMR
jgi:hypothetical protein